MRDVPASLMGLRVAHALRGMTVATRTVMAQPGYRAPGGHEVREPGFSALVVGPVAIVLALVLMVLAVVLITFAQVLPAMLGFMAALIVGLFGVSAALSRDESEEATEDEGVPPHVPTREERREALMGQIAWALRTLLAVIFVSAGLVQVLDVRFVVVSYEGWEYPTVLRWTVGLVEMLAAVALLVPRITTVGAVTLAALMAGAVYTLLSRGAAIYALIPLVLLLLLAFVGWQSARRHALESHGTAGAAGSEP